MRRAVVVGALLIAVLAITLCVSWAAGRGSASASNGLVCSVKASCAGGEVTVFRMSSTGNAHAGTPGGSAYGNVVCCSGVAGLGTNCSGTYDTVLTLSATDNAHVASDASYPTGVPVCLSAATGTVDCTYGASCESSACVATISGATNAHVADCGAGAYETKVCCGVEAASPCTTGSDTDNDGFKDEVEWYLPTDCEDACPDIIGGDDAWPLDINMDRVVTVPGDVLKYAGRINSYPGQGMWLQRLDLNKDSVITVPGDVLKYAGKINQTCT